MILGKRKHSVLTLLFITVVFASKSTSDDSLGATGLADSINSTPASLNVKDDKSDEKDPAISNSEKNSADAKSDSGEKEETPEVKEEIQLVKTEDSDKPSAADSPVSQSEEKVAEAEQPASIPPEKIVEENKVEEQAAADANQRLGEETKKQNVKLGEPIRKISLSDANVEGPGKVVKRETRSTDFLGLPRDASYFFDDLEPFINNNSKRDSPLDGGRVARATPSREKVQKAKFGGKKDMEEEEVGEEEEEEIENEKFEEEDDKSNEGEYEDDEEIESDCQILTKESCSTEPTEVTSHQCTKPSTCSQRKTTTKCSTRPTCPTKCPTTEKSTRCAPLCAKANRRFMGYKPTTVKIAEWDELETSGSQTTERKEKVLDKDDVRRRLNGKANSGKLSRQ